MRIMLILRQNIIFIIILQLLLNIWILSQIFYLDIIKTGT